MFFFLMLFSINSRKEVKYFQWQSGPYQYSWSVPKNCEVLFANKAFFELRVIERAKPRSSLVDIRRKLLLFVYTNTPPLADTLARCYIDEKSLTPVRAERQRDKFSAAPRSTLGFPKFD